MRLVLLIAVCLTVVAETGRAENDVNREASVQQSIGKVTMRVEKIAIQRMIAEPPIVKRYGLRRADFERTVSVLISIRGGGNNHGPITIDFAKDDTQAVAPLMHMSPQAQGTTGVSFDAKAEYMELWFTIPADASLGDLFPATLEFHTTDRSEKPLRFLFKKLTF